MPAASSGLWRHADFLKFWLGQTISGFGSRFTGLALPFVAIAALDATPAQLGMLTAASGLPWLLLGPLIGVGIDRLRRRPILIATDLGRAALLASIPLAALLGQLRIEQLYLVAFLLGILSAWFDTAYQSYLPSLIARTQLIEGNGKLHVSSSAADVAGPSLAGLVIQAFSAPLAIMVDALSFCASALSLALIRTREPAPSGGGRQAVWAALGEGVAYLWRHALLRAFAGANATFMLCIGMSQAVLLLFCTPNLQLSPSAIGLVFGVGGVGGLLGAVVAGAVSRRARLGPTIIGASLLRGLGLACVPLAGLLPLGVVPLLVGAYALHQFGWSVWAVTQASARQALVPDRLQGRVTASFLFLVRGATPLGALAGGVLGTQLGVAPTLTVAGVGLLLSTGWLVLSPLWSLREPPAVEMEAAL
jgi:MFS family permease